MIKPGFLLALSILFLPALAEPIVIAHRGASGYYPEHTLAAFEAAIDMGADYIEPDLVVSKDGHLIVRHDLFLSTTTDIADHQAFAARITRRGSKTDWFVDDFNLDELKVLRTRQYRDTRSSEYDGEFGIPTFDDVIALVERKQGESGRAIGLYPELKSPDYFRQLGFDIGELLLRSLDRHGLDDNIFIQSFDPVALRALNEKTDLPLVMLVTGKSRENPFEPNIPLEKAAEFADAVGAMKYLLIAENGEDSGFIAAARRHGLGVHVWTFRNDYVLPLFGSPEDELGHFLDLGIDGFFTDYPDTGVSVRNARGKGL